MRLLDEMMFSRKRVRSAAAALIDVVRFGESQGMERIWVRDNAWRYRDWVIGAYNDELPYQFAALRGGVTQESNERSGITLAPEPRHGEFQGTAHVIVPRQPPVFQFASS